MNIFINNFESQFLIVADEPVFKFIVILKLYFLFTLLIPLGMVAGGTGLVFAGFLISVLIFFILDNNARFEEYMKQKTEAKVK